MNTLRFNITVPADIGKRLKGLKNISAFITESVREKLAREEHAETLRTLEAAYREGAVRDRTVEKEWEGTVEDGL